MKLVDYRHFTAPISDDIPAGDDLEYDADFLSIIDILSPQAVAMVATEDDDAPNLTDWNGSVALCETLAAKTRDLRVSVRLARCCIKSDQGIAGFAGAVNVIAILVENMWDTVHPVLDAEDDMDATMRFNALNELSDPQVLKDLSKTAIAMVAKQTLSLHDIEVSIGKTPAQSADEQNIASGKITEIFAAAHSDTIVTAKALADNALLDIARIRAIWSEKMDALANSRREEGLNFDNMPAPQFESLTRLLGDISRHIAERLPQTAEEDANAEGTGKATPKAAGAITTRADADRAILNITEWFRRNEPSSPVSIMLERARSMISKSFLEIIDELGEGGIAEAKKVSGTQNEQENGQD